MFFSADAFGFLETGTILIPGSRVVQIALTLGFFALMFWGARRGYWRGPMRQLAPLVAFLIAAVVAYFFGNAFGEALLGYIGVPWIFRGICGACLLCLFVWLPIFSWLWWKGRSQVSEKTGEPEHPVLGSIVGCWTGIFCGGLIFFGISATGTIGEAYLSVRPQAENTWHGKFFYAAGTAKNSVALYPALSFLKTWRPLPHSFVRVASKTLDVLASPEARRRLLRDPEIRSLATDPAIYPVLTDPEISAMIDRRDVNALLSDERVLRMFYDENFQRRITALDLEPLLDDALGTREKPNTTLKNAGNF